MAFTAPIDHTNAFKSAMTAGLQGQGGHAAGSIDPMTTKEGAPVGMAKAIRMNVKPHLMKSPIKHSLAAAVLK
jgi:hypothetical protein